MPTQAEQIQIDLDALNATIVTTTNEVDTLTAQEQTDYATRENYRAALKLSAEEHTLTAQELRDKQAFLANISRLTQLKSTQLIYYTPQVPPPFVNRFLFPNAVSTDQFVAFGAPTTLECLNIQPPDDTKYIYNNSKQAKTMRLFYEEPYEIPAGQPITRVRLITEIRLMSGSSDFNSRLVIGGVVRNKQFTIVNTGNYETYESVWTTNPATGANWTRDEIADQTALNAITAFEIRTTLTSAANIVRVRKAYLLVD